MDVQEQAAVEVPAIEQTASNSLTLQNLRVLAGAIELGSTRGAWRAAELEIIGAAYNVLAAFLVAAAPPAVAETTDAAPAE